MTDFYLLLIGVVIGAIGTLYCVRHYRSREGDIADLIRFLTGETRGGS